MQTLFSVSLLKPENVRLVKGVSSWEDAVRLGLAPLVDGGFVEPRYVNGVIANTREFGPYYIIAPGLAFVHGRPDQGALAVQMAVTVLAEAVDFGRTPSDSALNTPRNTPCHDPAQAVRLLVALSATDSETHLEVLRSLAVLFKDEARIEGVLNATSPEEAYTRFAHV